ncbi:sensor domain-containing diguanylate cyclase [Desulfovibrio inopinatus]|uniref:sensor domain-containing diguanylate cyclase n=1 Tax=Desulfovibrio inopinatus TaxID=102109 RepID=UPI0004294B16|nr:sensor domain-containing diguanylate cyclase [Desulfovibrio inopinatus]
MDISQQRRGNPLKKLDTAFLLFLLIGAFLSGVMFLVYEWEHENALVRLKLREQLDISSWSKDISSSFSAVIADVLFLSELSDLKTYLADPSPANQTFLEDDFTAFSDFHDTYDQVRLIDQTGMERVRINRTVTGPVAVPLIEMQSKADRYYFKDALILSRLEVFVSPLDLNIEHGRIEEPFKPMIRFGTPVFDRNGVKRGVVLVNYIADNMLNALRRTSTLGPGQAMLINRDGFWLLAPDPDDEWGFMLPSRVEKRFSNRYPDLWEMIQTEQSGQISTDEGLFTFTTVYPLRGRFISSSSGAASPTGDSSMTLTADEYVWKIVSFVSQSHLEEISNRFIGTIFLIGAGLFVGAAVLAWYFSSIVFRHCFCTYDILQASQFDSLTGLPDRPFFSEQLRQAHAHAVKSLAGFALFDIDIDSFETVNETSGQDIADKLLNEVAVRLSRSVRPVDTLGRIGGDEFGVIVPRQQDEKILAEFAQNILDVFRVPFALGDREIHLSASIGIAIYPRDAEAMNDLFAHARQALSEAKTMGNCYRFFSW